MVRKQYILTGPSFQFEENDEEEVLELHAKFENPRALRQVSVTHAGFTFDLGNSPPPQLYLRSKALAEYTTTSARELSGQGAETSSDVLGHVALVHSSATSDTGHYELQRPVTLTFGTNPRKVQDFDFYVTDHAGLRKPFLMDVTEAIDRYSWEGEYVFDPDTTATAHELTHTWGPNEQGGTGGTIDFAGNGTTWSYSYATSTGTIKWENNSATKWNTTWDPDQAAFVFVSESWTGLHFNLTAELVPDGTTHTWTTTALYSGTITGGHTWSYDPPTGIVTVLWNANAATWYTMEINPEDAQQLLAVADYGNIHTVGTVLWQLSGEDSYVTSDSGYGFTAGSVLLQYGPYLDDDEYVPYEEEVVTQFPHASIQLSTDSAH